MKTIFLLLLLSCSSIALHGQDRSYVGKDPNAIGACINVTSKLAAINSGPIKNDGVTIWTLDEVVLVAKVEMRGGKRTRVGWAIIDDAGNQVAFDTASRTRPRGNKVFDQTIVYTRGTNPEGCFVVEQRER